MKTIVLTGATSGLGLAFATQLAKDPDIDLVLAVSNLGQGERLAQSMGRNVRAAYLDLASRKSIQAFTDAWSTPLFALINNAGLQITGDMQTSPDGVEMTLAVNHLGPLQLTIGLLPWLSDAVVLGVGSGTHNPDDRIAKLFGFRGGQFSSIGALAKGEMEAKTAQQAGMDRYATSKLCFMAAAVEMARRYPDTRFVTLDPGLMPGTGLVRTAPVVVKWAWRRVMPLFVPFVSGASSPTRSATAGCQILFDAHTGGGRVYDHNGKVSESTSDQVLDPEFGKLMIDQSATALQLVETAIDAHA